MGRKEEPKEGYVVLDKLCSLGDTTPSVIYASSNLPEHKKPAREHGAIRSANRADELSQVVMDAIANGS